MTNVKIIAYYLPQFHPIPENDDWWGKGFTEWTNVTKAKSLFRNHRQPFLPGELGFYDLRLYDSQLQQARLAKENGIHGFCYWHYWFGNGKRILEKPFNNVVAQKSIDLPFCLAWANESWTGHWHGLDKKKVLVEQHYPGIVDYENHFYALLDAFKDQRYIRIDGKLLFCIYRAVESKEIPVFINTWRKLAAENGLGDFHFNAINSGEESLKTGCDSFTSYAPRITTEMVENNFMNKIFFRKYGFRFSDFIRNFPHKGPSIYQYKDLIRYNLNAKLHRSEIPVITSNWDNTPRSQRNGLVIENSNAVLFSEYLKKAFYKAGENNFEDKVIFVKSWNEWAEGNVIEPSQEHSDSYLKAIKQIISENN